MSLTEQLEMRRKSQLESQGHQATAKPMRGYAEYAASSLSESKQQKEYEKRYMEFQHQNQRMPSKGEDVDKWYDKHMAAKKQKDANDPMALPSPKESIRRMSQEPSKPQLQLDESMGGKQKRMGLSMA